MKYLKLEELIPGEFYQGICSRELYVFKYAGGKGYTDRVLFNCGYKQNNDFCTTLVTNIELASYKNRRWLERSIQAGREALIEEEEYTIF